MKRLFLITLTLFSMSSHLEAQSSSSWQITWNKKILLQTSKEDETANVKTIKAAELTDDRFLEVVYKEASAEQEKIWKRSILFFDDHSHELMQKDSTRNVKLSGTDLKQLFGDRSTVKIYTVAYPLDPSLGPRVRVRRVHLCTLELN